MVGREVHTSQRNSFQLFTDLGRYHSIGLFSVNILNVIFATMRARNFRPDSDLSGLVFISNLTTELWLNCSCELTSSADTTLPSITYCWWNHSRQMALSGRIGHTSSELPLNAAHSSSLCCRCRLAPGHNNQ